MVEFDFYKEIYTSSTKVLGSYNEPIYILHSANRFSMVHRLYTSE